MKLQQQALADVRKHMWTIQTSPRNRRKALWYDAFESECGSNVQVKDIDFCAECSPIALTRTLTNTQ